MAESNVQPRDGITVEEEVLDGVVTPEGEISTEEDVPQGEVSSEEGGESGKPQPTETEKKLIGQITELRKKNQELQVQKLGEKPEEAIPSNSNKENDPEQAVRKVLNEQFEKERKVNRSEALRLFQESHPEYHPENDLSGVRMDSLLETLSRLNISESRNVNSILRDFEDSHYLMNKGKEKPNNNNVDSGGDASTSSVSGRPRVVSTNQLSDEENALREGKGWSIEKFIQMKAKYPDILQTRKK